MIVFDCCMFGSQRICCASRRCQHGSSGERVRREAEGGAEGGAVGRVGQWWLGGEVGGGDWYAEGEDGDEEVVGGPGGASTTTAGTRAAGGDGLYFWSGWSRALALRLGGIIAIAAMGRRGVPLQGWRTVRLGRCKVGLGWCEVGLGTLLERHGRPWWRARWHGREGWRLGQLFDIAAPLEVGGELEPPLGATSLSHVGVRRLSL